MRMLKNHKTKGFTLLELLLIVSLITILITAIYIYYDKKRTDANVTLQLVYLENIQKGLDEVFRTSTDFSILNSTQAITWKIIPDPLIKNPNTIINLFGGSIDLGPSPAPISTFNGYYIKLNNLNQKECSKLALNDYASKIPQVLINGTNVKTIGQTFSSIDIPTVTANCASSSNNTIEFRGYPYNTNIVVTPSTAPVIPKQTDSIPAIGNNVSGTPTCTGGSSWNNSFCGCPAGNIWSGNSCIALNSTPSSCQPGWAWNGNACANLPATDPSVLHYASPPTGYNPTLSGSIVSKTAAYGGGRYLPTTPVPPIQVINPQPTQQNCTSLGGVWDGRICNICPNAATAVVKNSAGVTVALSPAPHIAKSAIDGYRCVTPVAGW